MDDKNLIPEGALGLMFGAAGAMATKDKAIAQLQEENAATQEQYEAVTELAETLREENDILRSDLDNRVSEVALLHNCNESMENQLNATKSSHAAQQRNTLVFQSLAETRERERDEARNENGLLRGANQEAAETIALLREENERFRRERGVFLKAGLSNTDALPADGLNMLQVGIEETVVQNARLREELRQSKAACEMQQLETVGATLELARLQEENETLRATLAASEYLESEDVIRERDEARALLREALTRAEEK